ncbi:protein chibby homolog 2 isoform X1 [Callithrix jacchus]
MSCFVMSPLECSECFGDQLLHRTYTWQLTLNSRPDFTRKRDPRSESPEIPVNVVLPQRGAAEPSPRLHSSCSPGGCARPRLSRGVGNHRSAPLIRVSSAPLDRMEPPLSQADLELDYNPPRVQLSDEMFVFQGGRWVSENCRLQPPCFSPSASFHRKLHHKRLPQEWVLQEETRALREETRLLRGETRLLRRETRLLLEENRLLQAWEEHKAPRGGQDSAAPERVKEDHAALQGPRGQDDSALQLLREENRALRQLLEQRQSFWARAEDAAAPAEESKPAPSAHEEPRSPGLLQDQGSCLSSPFEEPKGPLSAQEDPKAMRTLWETVGDMSGPPGEEAAKAGPGLPDDCQPLQMLRVMSQALEALREENRLLQENRALHVLREERRGFLEENKALWENNKLKVQQKLVIHTVTEVTARMEMLIEELYAFMQAEGKGPKKPSRI